MQISKDHGHACSVETIGSDVAIFRNAIKVKCYVIKEYRKKFI